MHTYDAQGTHEKVMLKMIELLGSVCGRATESRHTIRSHSHYTPVAMQALWLSKSYGYVISSSQDCQTFDNKVGAHGGRRPRSRSRW